MVELYARDKLGTGRKNPKSCFDVLMIFSIPSHIFQKGRRRISGEDRPYMPHDLLILGLEQAGLRQKDSLVWLSHSRM